jgi:formate/nitrite transporter
MHTPDKVTASIANAGKKKAELPLFVGFLKGILAGVFLSFGGCFAITTAGAAPAEYQKILLGSVFPVGLCLIVFTGMELFTGNNMFMTIALLDKKCKIKDLIINWFSSWLGNFIGSLIVSYFLVYLADIPLTTGKWAEYTRNLGFGKINNAWMDNFLRAISCNMLVCLALFMANCADDAISKIVCIFLPIFSFVTSGFEHSVANMFFIPTSLFLGIDATWGKFLYNNLLPVTLGNIVGGSLCVGAVFWFIYSYSNKKESNINQEHLDECAMFPVINKD